MTERTPEPKAPVWRAADGSPISCLEKIKVLNENFEELHQMCQDALEDAVLMGCEESQVKGALHALIDSLATTFKKR
jgi:hypothetical protein